MKSLRWCEFHFVSSFESAKYLDSLTLYPVESSCKQTSLLHLTFSPEYTVLKRFADVWHELKQEHVSRMYVQTKPESHQFRNIIQVITC